MTFRVEEEEEEVEEELQDTAEAPTNPRIGEGGEEVMMMITQHGMHHNLQALEGEETKMMMDSGGLTMEIIVSITPKKSLRIETLMAIQPMIMTQGKMRKEKELGVLVLGGKDIGETEV